MVDYYELVAQHIDESPPPRGELRLMTAAVMDCGLCGRMVAGMGGPGNGVVCKPCGDALKHGHLRGAVDWGFMEKKDDG